MNYWILVIQAVLIGLAAGAGTALISPSKKNLGWAMFWAFIVNAGIFAIGVIYVSYVGVDTAAHTDAEAAKFSLGTLVVPWATTFFSYAITHELRSLSKK